MKISIIAAIGKNNVIGVDNGLPWNLPADINHFKKMTINKPVIMGHKTFESIGKPLPNRENIILTLDKDFAPEGCLVAYSIEEALKLAGDVKEVMIIGGVSIYKQFLSFADKMYLTLIDGEFAGDAFFPEFNKNEWQEVVREDNEADEINHYNYSFITLERKK